MNFVFTDNGLRIGRDSAEPHARRESEIFTRAARALGAFDAHTFNPSRYGMTDCRRGLYFGNSIRRAREVYWHANYMVEDARTAWNDGSLFLHKA